MEVKEKYQNTILASNYCKQLFLSMCTLGVKKAKKFVSKDFVIKITRKSFSRSRHEFVVTSGKPNYLERKFIKDCIKAKEPFPIKKVQVLK